MWTPDEFARGSVSRSQILFVLAWFHAIVQERRKYIPQVINTNLRSTEHKLIYAVILHISLRVGLSFMNFLKPIYVPVMKLSIESANVLRD